MRNTYLGTWHERRTGGSTACTEYLRAYGVLGVSSRHPTVPAECVEGDEYRVHASLHTCVRWPGSRADGTCTGPGDPLRPQALLVGSGPNPIAVPAWSPLDLVAIGRNGLTEQLPRTRPRTPARTQRHSLDVTPRSSGTSDNSTLLHNHIFTTPLPSVTPVRQPMSGLPSLPFLSPKPSSPSFASLTPDSSRDGFESAAATAHQLLGGPRLGRESLPVRCSRLHLLISTPASSTNSLPRHCQTPTNPMRMMHGARFRIP